MDGEESVFYLIDKEASGGGALLWMSRRDPDFERFPEDLTAYMKQDALFREAVRMGRALHVRDLIVDPDAAESKAYSYLLFWRVFEAMLRQGYAYGISEIYRILSYTDGGGTHKVDMDNEGCMRIIRDIGCVETGYRAPQTIRVMGADGPSGVTAEVLPRIVIFEFETIANRLKKRFSQETGGEIQ
jgi:hypothetical protein